MAIIWVLIALTVKAIADSDVVVGSIHQTVLMHENATLRCEIMTNSSGKFSANDGPVDFKWSFTSYNSAGTIDILQPGENVGTHDSKTKYLRPVWTDLLIVAVDEKDVGTYTCVAPSGASDSSDIYVLESAPECVKNNEGPKYVEGQNVTLNCTVGFFGSGLPTLTWHAPKLIQGPLQFTHTEYTHISTEHVVQENFITSVMKLTLKHMIDGKIFTCDVNFPGIAMTYSCSTSFPPESVQYAPFITTLQTFPHAIAHDHKALLGSNITLYCTAHGNPTPKWTWTFISKDGTVIRDLSCDQIACPVHSLREADAGTYTCTVTNEINGQEHSEKRSLSLEVIVKEAIPIPSILTTMMTPIEHKDTGFSPYAIGAIVSASLAVVLIIIFILLAMKMRLRERRMHDRLTRMHDENLDDQEVELLDENIQPDQTDLPHEYGRLKQQWEIARKDVRLVDLVAKGTFIEVWRGRMRKYPRRNEIMKVAIKRIISEATEKERRFFLQELEVLKAIQNHPNILPLIGCYTATDPWLIMVEFASEGTLYQYLQHRRPGDVRVQINIEGRDSVSLKSHNLSPHKLLSLASHVVNGIEHLNKFKMIYYRLRAAGVLVCKGGTCKLSGFGFVQDITDRNLYETNSAPVRWMAPESLVENVFNVKTDVWAFGVLLWEVVHFGHLPYPGMGPHEVAEKIQTGYRMPQPSHCSEEIYNLMLMCWAHNPENRPSFGDILQVLTHLAENAPSHIDLDKLPEGLKCSDIVENAGAMA